MIGIHLRFFVEAGREFIGVESEFNQLIGAKSAVIILTLGILAVRGHLSMDKFRWEVSSWS